MKWYWLLLVVLVLVLVGSMYQLREVYDSNFYECRMVFSELSGMDMTVVRDEFTHVGAVGADADATNGARTGVTSEGTSEAKWQKWPEMELVSAGKWDVIPLYA